MQISNSHKEKDKSHIQQSIADAVHSSRMSIVEYMRFSKWYFYLSKRGQGFSISLILMLLSMLLAYSYITDIAVEMVRYPK